ncbi:MAG TPA: DUF1501 domain-containing protein [Gemmatimonadales bacterium]|jgi:uncharacterized protein (DUF1501 family)|nr:DUF1501 domain-containing protein [Gemmatimonadales bacterium]
MPITRRAFVAAGGLALVSLGADPVFLDRAAYALRAAGPVASGKTLVCLFQRGAVDGLSMIVPAGDSWYWQDRQRIALQKNQLVPLDDMFALNPRLAALKPLWDQRSLAIVHAVGSPSTTRSHFDAQDYMESGTPDVKNTPDGWANRFCTNAAEHVNTPFRAVAFGPQLPRTLAGSAPALAIDDLRTFGMRAAQAQGEQKLTRAFEELYQGAATGLVATSSAESFEAIKMLKTANPSAVAPANGADYGKGKLGQSLQQIAQLIKADLGVEIAFVDVGGWDTHVNQGADQGQLATRLDELGNTLAAFTTDLGPRMRDVVVVTMSEFGRTVKENGTGGTDHGHGTAMMILGGDVKGGKVYGKWPGLAPDARYEGRDLAVTTDFRAVFGEVLHGHLGAADLSRVFPGFTGAPPMGMFG